MGFVVAIFMSAFVIMIASMTRPVFIAYAYLFILVFFPEYGQGFTSFEASIFFNQNFLNFFNFKLIEMMIGSSYLYVLLTCRKSGRSQYLKFEKILAFFLVFWLIVISFVNYWLHGNLVVAMWRLMASGIILFHMLYILLDTKEKVLSFAKYFMIFMGAKACIGLMLYFAGYGVQGLRGTAPFFWDDRLIEAFGLSAAMLTIYLANYKAMARSDRCISKPAATVFLVILLITIALCMRRYVWFIAAGSIMLVLFSVKTVRIQHYLSIMVMALLFVVIIVSVPAFHEKREKIFFYMNSMNIFNEEAAESVASNATHMHNVQQYSRIILEDPRILMFGFTGRIGDDYLEFEAELGSGGPLGTAHNGLLATTQKFGLVGLVIYLLFYLRPISLYGKVKRLPDSSPFKYISLASLAFLLMDFIASILFIPAFHGSLKGAYFIFLSVFFIRASLYYSNEDKSTDSRKDKPDRLAKSKRILISKNQKIINNR